MGGDKNCHGIELAHWQTSCIAGLTISILITLALKFVRNWTHPFFVQHAMCVEKQI